MYRRCRGGAHPADVRLGRGGCGRADDRRDRGTELVEPTVGDTDYIYDADGTLLLRRGPQETSLFVGDLDITMNNTTRARQAVRRYTLDGYTFATKKTTGTGTADMNWLINDQHNTTEIAVGTINRQVQQRFSTPFGADRTAPPATWPDQHGFLGKPNDKTTGLTHVGAREYDPTIGRFISVDPLMNTADPQSLLGYAYANNNPTSMSDPTGLINQDDGGAPIPPDENKGPDDPPVDTGGDSNDDGGTTQTDDGGRRSFFDKVVNKAKSVGKSSSEWFNRNPNPRKWTADYVENTGRQWWDACTPGGYNYAVCHARTNEIALWFAPGVGSVAARPASAIAVRAAEQASTRRAVAIAAEHAAEHAAAKRAPSTESAAESGDKAGAVVRYDPKAASRNILVQVGEDYARTPGGRTVSAHGASRIVYGAPGRSPTTLSRVDEILDFPTKLVYRAEKDTVRVYQGRDWVVVSGSGRQHVVTVMVR